HHDDPPQLAFVGHIKPAAADGDAFERRVAVGRTEIFLHRRPINVQALHPARARIPTQNPTVFLFANVDASQPVLRYALAVVASGLFRGERRELFRSEAVGQFHQISGRRVWGEFNAVNGRAAVAHCQQFAVGREKESRGEIGRASCRERGGGGGGG